MIWYRQAADAGNIRAMVHLGCLPSSKYGGLSQDLPAARAWLEKASAPGDAEAMYELGLLLRDSWDPPEESAAQAWLEKAAAAGHCGAEMEVT